MHLCCKHGSREDSAKRIGIIVHTNGFIPRKNRILVVEDEGIIARDIAIMLEDAGYDLSGEAATGIEAIRLAGETSTDLVLMDIKIRGLQDGIETAAKIRIEFDIPVVFLTSHADCETLKRANKTEPFGYVVKPFNESDLRVAIEVGLNRYRLQKEAEEKKFWFDTALSSLSGAVVATDNEGLIQFFSSAAEQAIGYTAEMVLQRNFSDVIRLSKGNYHDISTRDLDTVMADDQTLTLDNALIARRDGSWKPVSACIQPIRRSDSGLVYGVSVSLAERAA